MLLQLCQAILKFSIYLLHTYWRRMWDRAHTFCSGKEGYRASHSVGSCYSPSSTLAFEQASDPPGGQWMIPQAGGYSYQDPFPGVQLWACWGSRWLFIPRCRSFSVTVLKPSVTILLTLVTICWHWCSHDSFYKWGSRSPEMLFTLRSGSYWMGVEGCVSGFGVCPCKHSVILPLRHRL